MTTSVSSFRFYRERPRRPAWMCDRAGLSATRLIRANLLLPLRDSRRPDGQAVRLRSNSTAGDQMFSTTNGPRSQRFDTCHPGMRATGAGGRSVGVVTGTGDDKIVHGERGCGGRGSEPELIERPDRVAQSRLQGTSVGGVITGSRPGTSPQPANHDGTVALSGCVSHPRTDG